MAEATVSVLIFLPKMKEMFFLLILNFGSATESRGVTWVISYFFFLFFGNCLGHDEQGRITALWEEKYCLKENSADVLLASPLVANV